MSIVSMQAPFTDHIHMKEVVMRFRFVPLTCLALFVLASPVMAKDKKQTKQIDQQAEMEAYMKLATPGEPHKLFHTASATYHSKLATPGEPHKLFTSLAGSWTTSTKEWMEPGKPPTESTGTAEMKMLLDGRFLYQEFSGNMMGQPFSGVGIDAYDNMTKKYMTAWMDTMGTGIFMMEGTASADGKTITLRGSHPEPGGGKMTHRAVWKIVDNNTQTFDMYGAHHGGKEMKVLEITYNRKP